MPLKELTNSDVNAMRRDVAGAMTVLRRIGELEIVATAKHNSVRTLRYDTSYIFDNGSTCTGRLLSGFTREKLNDFGTEEVCETGI
jgi:hypothetical protein